MAYGRLELEGVILKSRLASSGAPDRICFLPSISGRCSRCVEIVGERGILFINRRSTRTTDLPSLMLFGDVETTLGPVPRDEWQYSFIDSTQHLLDVLANGGQPRLASAGGKAVLQFALAAVRSEI